MDEKLAKEKLEDEAGIYFEYSRAKYDEGTKTWIFSIINKDGRRLFRASSKEDFDPYIALSKHLNIPFEEVIAEYVWVYGEELEITPNEVQHQFCYTQEGWLAVSDIVKTFTERFGTYGKDNLLRNITWKLVIDKNECSSSTYKKNDKPGWPNLNIKVSFPLKELEDKIIKIASITKKTEPKVVEEKPIAKAPIEEAPPKTIEEKPIEKIPIEEAPPKTIKKESSIKTPEKPKEEIKNEKAVEKAIELLKTKEVKNEKTVEKAVELLKTKEVKNEKTVEAPKQEIIKQEVQKKEEKKHVETQKPTQKKSKHNHKSIIVAIVFLCIVIATIATIVIKNLEYTIYFDAKGGEFSIDTSRIRIVAKANERFAFPSANDVIKKGYVLIGWSNENNPYKIYENYIPHGTDYYKMKREDHGKTFYAVWGREMYINAEEKYNVNMRSTPIDYKDGRNVKFKLKQGTKVIMFENCYQGDDSLWAPVVATNPVTNKEEVVFAHIDHLRYFYIKDILFGNAYKGGKIITATSLAPMLYANQVRYLMIEFDMLSAQGRSDQEEFSLIVKRENNQGVLYTYCEFNNCIDIVGPHIRYYLLGKYGGETPGTWSRGRYYIYILHKNKINSKCEKIEIARKEIYLN